MSHSPKLAAAPVYNPYLATERADEVMDTIELDRVDDGAQRILVVDDALETQLMIGLRLQREGYLVSTASNGAEAIEIVRHQGLPRLAILDISMPGMNGFDLAEELRRLGDVPIIFLTALADMNCPRERVECLSADQLTKPIAFPDLLIHIQQILRHVAEHEVVDSESIVDDRLRINFAQQYAVVRGRCVPLTPTENRLLHTLFVHRGRVLTPAYIIAQVWDGPHKGTMGSLWVHIRRVRSKIELEPEHPQYLVTMRGQGYSLQHHVNQIH